MKKGQLLAKLDVSQYRFEVDRQKLEYQGAVQAVSTSKRNSERDVQQAKDELDRMDRSIAMMGTSTSVETEQAQAQVNFDTWSLTRTQQDLAREKRLFGFGLRTVPEVETAERGVRAKEYSLTASRKGLEQKGVENQIKQAQAATDIETSRFNLTLAQRRVKASARESAEQVKQAKEGLDRMQMDLANGELRAPRTGWWC